VFACRLTEADVRLLPTVCRFDAVYAGIFKCGQRRVADYPHLQAWLRDMWQIQAPGLMQVHRAAVSCAAAAGAVAARSTRAAAAPVLRACHHARPPPAQNPAQVRDTVDIDGCRRSYYTNLFPLNPGGIVPSGPTAADLQLDAPAGRGSSALQDVCFMTQPAAAAAAAAATAV
jgi:putative glutathione S-transferase